MSNYKEMREEMVEIGQRIYDRGYVASNDGNLSIRLEKNKIMITPTGVSKGFMKADEMIIVDLDGNIIEGKNKPSSEIFMHLGIYKKRDDIQGICHTHPIYATAFAVAGIALDLPVLPEVIIGLGKIPLVEYGAPGTEEFLFPIMKYILNYDGFLLANHGALTIGKNLIDAYHKMETLEHFAEILYRARQLGNINILERNEVKKLFRKRALFGIREDLGKY